MLGSWLVLSTDYAILQSFKKRAAPAVIYLARGGLLNRDGGGEEAELVTCFASLWCASPIAKPPASGTRASPVPRPTRTSGSLYLCKAPPLIRLIDCMIVRQYDSTLIHAMVRGRYERCLGRPSSRPAICGAHPGRDLV